MRLLSVQITSNFWSKNMNQSLKHNSSWNLLVSILAMVLKEMEQEMVEIYDLIGLLYCWSWFMNWVEESFARLVFAQTQSSQTLIKMNLNCKKSRVKRFSKQKVKQISFKSELGLQLASFHPKHQTEVQHHGRMSLLNSHFGFTLSVERQQQKRRQKTQQKSS